MSVIFVSLRIRNYRLFLVGQVISVAGTWAQRVAQAWLVLDLTHGSGTALGIASGLQFLPLLLFGMWGGLLADRYPKRRILFITQAAMAALALGLGLLALADVVRLWHVYGFASCLGVVTAVDNPTRQSFLAELVGRERLSNAVGLNSAAFNVARLVGPASGGILVTFVGAGPAFVLNGLSYLAVLASLAWMSTEELDVEPPVPRTPRQLREGLRHIMGDTRLVVAVGAVFFVGSFAMNWQVMLPLASESVFHQGANGYGLSFSVLAVGSLLGSLLAAARPPRMRDLVGSAAVLGILELAAGLVSSFTLYLVLLVPIGFAALTLQTSANSTIQVLVPSEMRGRAMSVYAVANAGGIPIGAPILGWAADQFGAGCTFWVSGVVSILVALAGAVLLGRPLERPCAAEVERSVS